MPNQRVFLIGASAGGVDAMKILAATLPEDFPCPILLTLHIGTHRSILHEILERSGPLRARRAERGDALEAGTFLIAPPDRHMVLEGGRIALLHGAKEHHARPAIDPMLRSAAVELGPRAVGIILSGWGEDGTAGLQAIKHRGGIAVVQDPGSAQVRGMPFSALKYTPIDHCVRIGELGSLMVELASRPVAGGYEVLPNPLHHEHELFLGRGEPVKHLEALGTPAPYACPDCGGGLWALNESRPPRFRCHSGHAYTLRSLHHAQAQRTDQSLATAISGLQERAMLLRALASHTLQEGDAEESARLEVIATDLLRQAAHLLGIVEQMPRDTELEAAPQEMPVSARRRGVG
jgi:two-component system chemotaxis response regulator CheB